MPTILSIENLSKRFGGLLAVDDVSISIQEGAVHGIIGPNGAGKTTLFNLITGLIPIDRGQVVYKGARLPAMKPDALASLGISRTFQNLRLFRDMTVEDNVIVGQHVHSPTPVLSIVLGTAYAKRCEEEAREKAHETIRLVGLESVAQELAKNLPYGQQKLVELARALAVEPSLILLDEPAAGMNPTEKVALFDTISRLRKMGYTILLIEHDMRLVMSVCDRISVLNFGKKIAEGDRSEVRSHPEVISAYLGKGAVSDA